MLRSLRTSLSTLVLISLARGVNSDDTLNDSYSSSITTMLFPFDNGRSKLVLSTVSSANNYNFTSHSSRPGSNMTTQRSPGQTPKQVIDWTTLWQYQNGVAILSFGPPVLILLATVGNTLSVIILQNPMFRKSSTSFILSALAVVDMTYVNTGLMRQWIILGTEVGWTLNQR